MKRISILFLLIGLVSSSFAQLGNLHGDRQYRKEGILDGNLIRTIFHNHGEVAHWPFQPSGEWPKGSGHSYVDGVAPFVCAKVRNVNGEEIVILETQYREYMDVDPQSGYPMGFEPLPGFCNQAQDNPAMSNNIDSWPTYWPDKLSEADDPGWRGINLETGIDPDPEYAMWNGYFGKGVTNADLETYFVIDDYNDHEFPYYPMSADSNRGGLGIQCFVRGFQWSHVLAEDVIFWHYEMKNISDRDLESCLFGIYIDSGVGGTGDSEDDSGYFDRALDVAVAYDKDGLGTPGNWSPVGVVGYAYLESPGNPYNGIDDDGDAKDFGSGEVFSADKLDSISYSPGDDIVIIDYSSDNLQRTVTKMPNDSLVFDAWGNQFVIYPYTSLIEDPFNSVDDNLNGLIDESNAHIGLLTKNWITGEGLDNPMIDEQRDDGIDNNNNWETYLDVNQNGEWDEDEPLNDDKGRDGLGPQDPDYPGRDTGEGDGIYTHGEPNFDQTDKDESDQIGLTSVKIFKLHYLDLKDDEKVWNHLAYGVFDTSETLTNLGIIFASGPFPLKRLQSQRFSMALLFGEDLQDLVRNKDVVQKIYNANYNFARPPMKPRVKAVPGDGKVTLYWDRRAEFSKDPFLDYREDFEGYVIYRSTEYAFLEPKVITDSYGVKTFRKPVAQFDLIDGIEGPDPVGINGARFNRGDETGLKHQWTDYDVDNGQTYYYAVVSYDQGDPSYGEFGLPPTECTSTISVDAFGNVVSTDINTAVVVPNASAAGYQPPEIDTLFHIQGPGTGDIWLEILDPMSIRPDQIYEIRFDDTTKIGSVTFSVWNVTGDDSIIYSGADDFEGKDFNDVFDGIRPYVTDDPIVVDDSLTGWRSNNPHDAFIRVSAYEKLPYPADYQIVIHDTGTLMDSYGTSCNFSVHNITENEKATFLFVDANNNGLLDGNESAFANENILILEQVLEKLGGWQVSIHFAPFTTEEFGTGDTIFVAIKKPFRGGDLADVFSFQTVSASVDEREAKKEIREIAVVPNPYVCAASWEPNYNRIGRGPRKIDFINLPHKCTIRIYSFSGDLVDVIHHNSAIDNGAESWNLRSKDGLDVAFGIYFYHVMTPNTGEFIGKFALIK